MHDHDDVREPDDTTPHHTPADPSGTPRPEAQDTGSPDTGSQGAGSSDTGSSDTGSSDTATPDTAAPDLGQRIFHLGMLLRRADGRGGRGRGPRHHSQGQGRVLALLSLHSPVAQRDLGYLLGVRPQSLGEVLAKLEDQGLVARSADPDDARARLVSLTDAGRAAADELSRRPSTDPLAVLDAAERTAFLAMLDRITLGLEEALGVDADEAGRMRERAHGHAGRGPHGHGPADSRWDPTEPHGRRGAGRGRPGADGPWAGPEGDADARGRRGRGW